MDYEDQFPGISFEEVIYQGKTTGAKGGRPRKYDKSNKYAAQKE
jgi:hypothetical protein